MSNLLNSNTLSNDCSRHSRHAVVLPMNLWNSGFGSSPIADMNFMDINSQ